MGLFVLKCSQNHGKGMKIERFYGEQNGSKQWRSHTGAHWGTGPTISFCGPTINILTYHVHGVHSFTYTYTLLILIYKLQIPLHPLVSLAVGL